MANKAFARCVLCALTMLRPSSSSSVIITSTTATTKTTTETTVDRDNGPAPLHDRRAVDPRTRSSFIRDVVVPATQRHNEDEDEDNVLSRIMEKALPLEEYERRRLNDDDGGNDKNDDGYVYKSNAVRDFSAYAFKYARCQPVQRFSSDAANNGEYTALVTDFMVVFRLCPQRRCSDSSEWGCSVGYGEYVLRLSDYMRAMLYYQYDNRNKLCSFCEDCGFDADYFSTNGGSRARRHRRMEDAGDDGGYGGDDDGSYGGDDGGDDGYYEKTYSDECLSYAWLCNGFDYWCYSGNDDDVNKGRLDLLDYEDYLDCVNIKANDGRQTGYWVGPRCDASSGKISLAIWYDPYCSQYAGNDVNLKDVTGIAFSNKVFYHSYVGKCLSCSQESVAPLYGTTHYLCNKLYSDSGKCNQYLATSVDDDDTYDSTNAADSTLSCNYIENIRYDGYDNYGQVTGTTYSTQEPRVTIDQKVIMVVLVLFCVSLAFYSCVLHHEITNLLLHKLSYQGGLAPSKRPTRGWGKRKSANKDKDEDFSKTEESQSYYTYASDSFSYA